MTGQSVEVVQASTRHWPGVVLKVYEASLGSHTLHTSK
jgi:hypothetical protein